MNEITIEQTEDPKVARGESLPRVRMSPQSVVWLTPGSFIASRVMQLRQVTFVAERLENARYGVFVILSDDPEEVLDTVFSAEQEAMKELRGIAFDMRVRRPDAEWSPDDLLSSCVPHYQRP